VNCPRDLLATVIVLLVAAGCGDDGAAQIETARLAAELDAARAERATLTHDIDALRHELQTVRDDRALLEARRDAFQKRIAELEAAAQAAPPPPEPAAPPADDRPLLDARRQMEALAAVLFAREHYDVARLVALTAIELGSDRPEMHFHIAYGSADAGEDDAAAQAYAAAVDALEGRPDADLELLAKCLNNRAAALTRLGRTDEAEALYLRILALDADDSAAHFNLGLLYSARPERAADAARHLQQHIVHGGTRATTAGELILKLQQAQDDAD